MSAKTAKDFEKEIATLLIDKLEKEEITLHQAAEVSRYMTDIFKMEVKDKELEYEIIKLKSKFPALKMKFEMN